MVANISDQMRLYSRVIIVMMLLLFCCVQQRQERFTDCSAMLELERKVLQSLLMLPVVAVALTASLLLPPMLSLPSHVPRPHNFSHILRSSLSTSLPATLPHISLTSGPEDVGAADGRVGGGAKGEEPQTLCMPPRDSLCFSLCSVVETCCKRKSSLDGICNLFLESVISARLVVFHIFGSSSLLFFNSFFKQLFLPS